MKNTCSMRILSGLLSLCCLLSLLPMGNITAFAQEQAQMEAAPLSEEEPTTRSFPDNADYVDIPIEVLDFRGDGFLFDSKDTWSSPYSLSNKAPSVSGVSFPGQFEDGPTTASDDFRILGLVEKELYAGNVVYKPEVIRYVAEALAAKHSLKYPSGSQNGIFYKRVSDGLSLGDLTSTLKKANPPVNGGVLLWEQVESAYDMAYYMLSSIWREVPRTDTLGSETRLNGTTEEVCYNLPVPELTHLRLYKVDNTSRGKTEYTYNSYYGSQYDNGYIYNTNTVTHSLDPSFRPLNGRGFEAADYFGNNTEGRSLDGDYGQANYGFSIHAYGGFVYSEASDLYFTFSGDDDVYFFINDVLVCDVGGVHGRTHKTLELKDIAADLNLKDGQICSFDMFYAERHTTGVNMEFYTNIQLMDTDVITTKQQYDALNGAKLVDGAAVGVGTNIAYSFCMLNRRLFPVKNVEFNDSLLDTQLSPDGVSLNTSTSLSDLRLTYRSYNRNSSQYYEGAAEEVEDITTLYDVIAASVHDAEPLNDVAYSYKLTEGNTAQELQALLELGVPANCELTIYGFRHTVGSELFTNTVNSTCIPLSAQMNEDGTVNVVEQVPLYGTASCRIYGVDMGSISVDQPLSYVMDYGKAVEVGVEDAAALVSCDSGMSLEFIGMTLNGEHGAVKAEAPTSLFGTAEKPTAAGLNGTYTMDGNVLRFDPSTFLDAIERSYAVFRIRATSDQSVIAYIMVEIALIPANMMYYEAEDFTNHITYYEKVTDKTTGQVSEITSWAEENFKTENAASADAPQNLNQPGQEVYYHDYTDHPEVLFFGFDDTDADKERYSKATNGYGGLNFDSTTDTEQHWEIYSLKAKEIAIDNEAGTMSIKAQKECAPHGTSNDADQYPDVYVDTISEGSYDTVPLTYDPGQAEVFQIRFKLENFRAGTTHNGNTAADAPEITVAPPYVSLQYQTGSQKTNSFPEAINTSVSANNFHGDFMKANAFMTMTFDLKAEFRNCDKITMLRPFIGGIESISENELGVVTIDYMYIGPRELAPVDAAYGRDSTYDNDSHLSNGKSLYVEGTGTRTPTTPNPDNYSEIRFTFKGTGFDLISRTGPEQANIRVEVHNDPSMSEESCKVSVSRMLKGEIPMYQVPVYSKHDLPYGTYYVTVMVDEAREFPLVPALGRGNQFYLDGIRIYDPIDVSAEGSASAGSDSAIAYAAYCADREAYPVIKEFRDILLTAGDFNALNGETVDGALFVDYESFVQPTTSEGETTEGDDAVTEPTMGVTNHVTANVMTYDKVGPNNETYLGQEQLIAFKLMIYSEQLPDRIDIGCKTIDASSSQLRATLIKGDGTIAGVVDRNIKSSAAQYYSIPLWADQFTRGEYNGKPCYFAYLKIENPSPKNAASPDTNVLSVTDLKIAYSQAYTPLTEETQQISAEQEPGAKRNGDVELPTDTFDPIGFAVDSSVTSIVKELLEDRFDGECEHVPMPWSTVVEMVPGQDGLLEQRCALCGELLGQETVQAVSALRFAGASVSLQSDLSINYKVDESYFTELGYTEPYVVISVDGTQTVLREYRIQNGKYVFPYRNIAPHRIGDMVTATLYAKYEGELYCSESRDYSVATYCYSMLDKCSGEQYAKFRTLLVDMLHYGAKAQEYAAYRTDALCNAALTEEQLAWGTKDCRELVSVQNKEYVPVENPTVLWKGAGLNLRESVAIRFKIEAESYEDLVVKFSMAGKEWTVGAESFDHRKDGCYVFFRGLNAAQMSETVYATVYRNGEQVSHTICYSVESYAYNMQNDTIPYLSELVQRMICYGDSARNYIS